MPRTISHLLAELPAGLDTRGLEKHFNKKLGGGKDAFILNGLRFLAYVKENSFSAPYEWRAGLLAYARQMAADPRSSSASELGNVRLMLEKLGLAVQHMPAEYRNITLKLGNHRKQIRRLTLTVGSNPNAHYFTIDKLFPDRFAYDYRSRLEYAVARLYLDFVARPSELLVVKMCDIVPRLDGSGYYVAAIGTKTVPGGVGLHTTTIAALNSLAELIPGRHKLCPETDHLLASAGGHLLPGITSPGNYREKPVERHWIGRMLKRRAEVYCRETGTTEEIVKVIRSALSGKSFRKGGVAEGIHDNLLPDQQHAKSRHKDPMMIAPYAHGMQLAPLRNMRVSSQA